MNRRALSTWLLAAASPLAFASPAWASDTATATMLFNDAKQLVASGKYVDACPKFEESQRLDPGIGTQFNLADCYEHVGRTATAWALFLEVASGAKAQGQGARETLSKQRAAALEPELSKLTIVAPKGVMGLEVRRNGEVMGGILWGNAVPVDPGSYTIEATAPGKQKWSSNASVGPHGATLTITIPELASVDAPAPPGVVPGKVAEPPPAAASVVQEADAGRRSTQRVLGLVGLGAGAVGLGLGAGFGALSMSKHAEVTKHCVDTSCDQAGLSAHADAVQAGNVSTIAFIAGGVLAATGAVLWLTAPSSPAGARAFLAPTVGATSLGLTARGGF